MDAHVHRYNRAALLVVAAATVLVLAVMANSGGRALVALAVTPLIFGVGAVWLRLYSWARSVHFMDDPEVTQARLHAALTSASHRC